jgi:ribonuclease P protein component
VVHALRSDPDEPGQALPAARIGLVVGKAVGNSVVRHRVSRRIRHVVRDRLGTIPPGTSLVVRALPSAALASSADFRADIEAALRQLRLTADDHGGAV